MAKATDKEKKQTAFICSILNSLPSDAERDVLLDRMEWFKLGVEFGKDVKR